MKIIRVSANQLDGPDGWIIVYSGQDTEPSPVFHYLGARWAYFQSDARYHHGCYWENVNLQKYNVDNLDES